MDEEKLVPIEEVLEDMHTDKGIVSVAARGYYYDNYASPSEKVQMDFEDKLNRFTAIVILGVVIGYPVWMGIQELIKFFGG